jgi:uncharacterized protein
VWRCRSFAVGIDEDRYIIYAPLRRAAFLGNGAMVNAVADLRQGRIGPDHDGSLLELLHRLEIAAPAPADQPRSQRRGLPRPTHVTLFLTTGCNLRCVYCYASAGRRPVRKMSLSTACGGIDFVADSAAEQAAEGFTIGYHGGGEPTTHWSVMTGSLAYARRRAAESGLQVAATCATNGMVGDGQIDWMIENLDGMSISLDGLAEVQDRNRPTANGQPSSQRVLHAIGRFDEAGVEYGLRMTVTAKDVERLVDSVEFICERFMPTSIGVEPVYRMGRARDQESVQAERFIEAFREARRVARSMGREVRFSAARLDLLTSHFCQASEDSFALTPGGAVTACFEAFDEEAPLADRFFYGRLDANSDGFRFDLTVLEALRRQSLESRPRCRHCFARWHCAGDCLYKRWLGEEGSDRNGDSDRCRITRALLADELLDRIASAGGLFWHAPAPASIDRTFTTPENAQ